MYISASNFLLEIMDHKESWGRWEGEFASYSNELYIFFIIYLFFCYCSVFSINILWTK